MMKIRNEDTVKTIKMNGSMTFPVGTIGTVFRCHESYCLVRSGGDHWAYDYDQLRLIKKYIKPTDQIRHILSRHISNKKKMELIKEIVASNQT